MEIHNAKSEPERHWIAAREVIETLNVRTMRDSLEIYYHKNGVFVRSENRIEEYLEGWGGTMITRSFLGEVIGHIQRQTLTSRSEFDADPDILNVKNGIINVKNLDFQYHEDTPEAYIYLSTVQLPIKFNPNAKCPAIMKFLNEILDDENREKVIKMLGDILLADYRYQSLYFLVGSGANGKGTLMRLIKAFVGAANTAAVRLQSLAEDRFAAAHLYGKMVNLGGDVDAGEIKDWALLRSLSGGDPIYAQRKHGQPFEFTNRAKIISVFNTLPEVDNAFSTYRRIVLITFDRVFSEYERDMNLDDKLSTEQELSGLLNLALEGVQKLRVDNGYNESWKSVQQKYRRLRDHVADFITTDLIKDEDGEIETTKFRDLYTVFCEKKTIVPLAENVLGSRLVSMEIEKHKKRVDGKNVYFYHGVREKGSQTTLPRG